MSRCVVRLVVPADPRVAVLDALHGAVRDFVFLGETLCVALVIQNPGYSSIDLEAWVRCAAARRNCEKQ